MSSINTDIAPVKLIAALIYREKEHLNKALSLLNGCFSSVDIQGEFFSFDYTDYYRPEMGSGLKRGIVSFEKLVSPEILAEAKLKTIELEEELSLDQKRTVNIDIGYLDYFKVVLASLKGRDNKVYLSQGVWADIILFFQRGGFANFYWGFPDFNSGIYNSALQKIRDRYKRQMKDEQLRR